MKITRKNFISSSVCVAAGLTLKMSGFGNQRKKKTISNEMNVEPFNQGKMKICIFSKQLQWLNYQDMALAVAEMGFDGIDLTVRPNGHVLPERVADDLPKAVEAANNAGVNIYMISTDIRDVKSPFAVAILKTAAALDIRNYRTAGFTFQKDLDIPTNLEIIKARFKGLAEINKQYGLHSDYLNHSGEEDFGASIWDLWLAIKDLDPRFIGSQFDIKHSIIAGAYSWPVDLKLIHQYVRTIVMRDFHWEQDNGTWQVKPVPLGNGMVSFKKYFTLLKQYGVRGPISLMCDYPLGGAERGTKTLTIPKNEVLNAMKKDLFILKNWLKDAEI